MRNLIKRFEEILNVELDQSQYLLAGNAFGKKSLFLYKRNTSTPYIVVRIPYSSQGDKQCLREFRMLEFLEKQKIPGIIAPKGFSVYTLSGKTYYFHEVLPFESMLGNISLIRKAPPVEYFKIATSALITIYNKVKSTSKFEEGSFYRCFQHGDFWLGNIGFSNGEMALLDLEFSDQNGYPLFDLLHFGLYYLIVKGNIGKVGHKVLNDHHEVDQRIFNPVADTVINLLVKDNSLSVLMRSCILRYLKECSISRNDGLMLIKQYFENDRGIVGLDENWEKQIF